MPKRRPCSAQAPSLAVVIRRPGGVSPTATVGRMITLVRRVAAAMSMAGMVATFFRLRGTGGTPPRSGGWREVDPDDLR